MFDVLWLCAARDDRAGHRIVCAAVSIFAVDESNELEHGPVPTPDTGGVHRHGTQGPDIGRLLLDVRLFTPGHDVATTVPRMWCRVGGTELNSVFDR